MNSQFSTYLKNIGLNSTILALPESFSKHYVGDQNPATNSANHDGQQVQEFDADLNDRLHARTSKICGSSVDSPIAKKLFKLWAHLLKQDLPKDFQELLELFELPDKINSDADCLRFITAINIVTSCTVSIRFTVVFQVLLNTVIVYSMRWLTDSLSNKIFSGDDKKQAFWKQITKQKLDKLYGVLNDPEQTKRLKFKYLANKVQHFYRQYINNEEVSMHVSHPFISVFSDYLNEITNCVKEIVTEIDVFTLFPHEAGLDKNENPYKKRRLV
jgi:hypothetical protein